MQKIFCVAWSAIAARSFGKCTRRRHVSWNGNVADTLRTQVLKEIYFGYGWRGAAILLSPTRQKDAAPRLRAAQGSRSLER
jgi:hypothetical protein